MIPNVGPFDARGVASRPVSLTFDVGPGGAGRSYTLVAAALGACVPGALACAAWPTCIGL